MANTTDGKWITVNGTHIFIKNGQSVSDAFKATTGKSLTGGSSSSTGAKKTKSASEVVADAKKSTVKTTGIEDKIKIYKKNEQRIVEAFKENNKLKYEIANTANQTLKTSIDNDIKYFWDKHIQKGGLPTETVNQFRKANKTDDYDKLLKLMKKIEKR